MSERAWITFDRFNQMVIIDDGVFKGVSFETWWINAGRSPALEMEQLTIVHCRPSTESLVESPLNFDLPDTGNDVIFRAPIGPSQTFASQDITIPLEQFRRVTKGEERLFVRTKITYRDMFSNVRHHSAVCAEVTMTFPPEVLLNPKTPRSVFRYNVVPEFTSGD